ncbi:MAG: sigma-70 family RNA polymerase sigma factor [Planctomycetaceae bacterium]
MSDDLGQQSFLAFRETLQDGSEEAFREVVERFGPYVLRAIRRKLDERLRSRMDSQDCAQAVWLTLFKHRNRISELDSPEKLIAYLVTIAQRKARAEFRRHIQAEKQTANREVSLQNGSVVLDLVDHRPNRPSQLVVAKEQWDRLTDGEPERYRQILELRREGMSIDDIAAEVGVNERTVRRVLQRMAEKLRDEGEAST